MGKQNHPAALVGNLADGRSRALDAGRVGHFAVLDRHVEVDAHEHALALHVGLIERAKSSHRRGNIVAKVPEPGVTFRSIFPSQPWYRPCGSRSPIRCRTTTSPAPACRPSPWSGRWRTPTSAHRG